MQSNSDKMALDLIPTFAVFITKPMPVVTLHPLKRAP